MKPKCKHKTKRDVAYKFMSELEDDLGEIIPTQDGRPTGALPYKMLLINSEERTLLRKVLQEYLLAAWLETEKTITQ